MNKKRVEFLSDDGQILVINGIGYDWECTTCLGLYSEISRSREEFALAIFNKEYSNPELKIKDAAGCIFLEQEDQRTIKERGYGMFPLEILQAMFYYKEELFAFERKANRSIKAIEAKPQRQETIIGRFNNQPVLNKIWAKQIVSEEKKELIS